MRKAAIPLAALGLFSAVTAVAPTPAQAHDWNRYGREHNWRGDRNSGAAIGLGILGGILAGAAIASAQTYAAPPAYYYYYPPRASYYGAPYGYTGYGYYYYR